jgi:hypothetical protein
MLEDRWYRLLHYLRKGLTDAGQDAELLEANDRTLSVRIPIAETGLWWDHVVGEGDVLHGDLRLEADFLLTSYRIACNKAVAAAVSR